MHRRRLPFNHFVLLDEKSTQGSAELLLEAIRVAPGLALRAAGHPDRYTLIHNGAMLARKPLAHVHIVCTRSRFWKGVAYVLIGLKNLIGSATHSCKRKPTP